MTSDDVVFCCVVSEDEGNGGDLLSIMSIKFFLLVHMFVIPSSRHSFCKSGLLNFLSRNSLVGNSREASGGCCEACPAGVEELSTVMLILSLISGVVGDSVLESVILISVLFSLFI